MVLKCGHHEACMYRFRDVNGTVHKYCMACICIKSGIKECDAPEVIDKIEDVIIPVVPSKKPYKLSK